MDLGLKGKTALVTGASEGIGRAIAWKLAEEGVRVAICARTASKLQETAAAITHATGMDIVPLAVDLRNLAGCQGFVEQAAVRLGGIDILVNNAGASAFGAFMDLPDDAFVDAVNGKLLGYIRCARAVRSWTCPSPPVRWSRFRFNRAGLESRLPPVRITAHDKHPEVGCSTPVYFEIKELAHQSSRTPHRPGPRGQPEGRPGDPVMIWACGT
jgi:hypothetical protein